MKTLIITLLSSILFLCGGCHLRKNVNRESKSVSVKAKVTDETRQLQNQRFAYTNAIDDSTLQLYQITIFPTDTFRFSMEHGYVGKAGRVEVNGLIRQVTRGVETVLSETDTRDERSTKGNLVAKRSDDVLKKEMKRSGTRWVWGIALLVVLLSVAWLANWLRKKIPIIRSD